MKEVVKRLKNWGKGRKRGPYSIQLNPTNRCNLECRFCWQRTNDEIDYSEVSDERYADLIQEAKSLGVKEIEITGGGEPMMRKGLVMRLIEEVKNQDINGKLITNGTEFEERDLKKLVNSGWDEIVFSVDGTEETHNYLRQVEDCFQETISSMKKLNAIRNENPEMTLHMVLCKENYNEIVDVLKIASNSGCENFFIEPMVTLAFDTDMGKKLKMNNEETEKGLENIEETKKRAERTGINHNLGDLKKEIIERTNEMEEVIGEEVEEKGKNGNIEDAACFEPWYNMIIRPEGDVGPCCMFDNQGPNIKNNSLESIWFGEYFKTLRKKMKEHEMLSFCSKCNPSQVSDNRKIRRVLRNE